MDSEWVDACVDGSDLRVGDVVKFDVIGDRSAPRTVIQVTRDTVITAGPREWMRDRGARITRWQYHAPTRAKLVAADRERVTVTSITSDTITAQPAPPPDSEPGWDHVPAVYVSRGMISAVAAGDRYYVAGMGWYSAERQSMSEVRNGFHWIRRASHPERVRWLEERNRAVNTDSAIVAAVNSESTYARAPSNRTFPGEVIHCLECGVTGCEGAWCSCVTEAERERHYANIRGAVISRDDAREAVRSATVAVLVDPFAALRAEAKLMLDGGADPRVVLGALDECVRREDPTMWKLQIAYYTVEAIKNIARDFARASSKPCYHGNRAGTCGWCALSRDRSDSHTVESHEPAWETADCEGE